MGIGKKICVCKEYLRLEAKRNVISTGNNNTVCPGHTIEEVSSEATETTRTTVGLRRASVFLLMVADSKSALAASPVAAATARAKRNRVK